MFYCVHQINCRQYFILYSIATILAKANMCMTWPGITGFIYIHNIQSVHIMAPISCSVCAVHNLLLLMNFSSISAYNYDDILGTILITDKKLLHYELSKSSQNLCVDKTGFPRPSHILCCGSGTTLKVRTKDWRLQNVGVSSFKGLIQGADGVASHPP